MRNKYPVKSNWISMKVSDGDENIYEVKHHVYDENYEIYKWEKDFLDSLDGKTDPIALLTKKYGIHGHEAFIYLRRLKREGFIRYSRWVEIAGLSSMLTLIKIKDSAKYKGLSRILLILFAVLFIPAILLGINSAIRVFTDGDMFLSNRPGNMSLGTALGFIAGVVLHEMAHAASCISFGGKVMEFGAIFSFCPSAYTLMDSDLIESRIGKIVTDLAGVMTNFVIAALSITVCAYFDFYPLVFYMIAFINLDLGIINILFIDGLDGMHTLERILGKLNMFDSGKTYLKAYRSMRRRKPSESEKATAVTFSLIKLTKLFYPAIIALNICLIWGW